MIKSTLQEQQEWQKEFDAAARRSLRERMQYSFIYTYKPVLDDAPYRSFATMEEYRQWCKKNLPSYLGY
ncbi:MAG: hypothetical protein ONB44_13000 [candidate division KSB1 bacterium]|nr:hypothetical protein [candidate division KSB1 bacterium]MDZ7303038.1 hypothetical protein [candidate division KSB1 bacterium]MDZ7312454.1 hypothetical protein [candidate division KSB1 bacterium]